MGYPFLAYLQGIETRSHLQKAWLLTSFLAYLQGIETFTVANVNVHSPAKFLAYLQGIETAFCTEYPPNNVTFLAYLQGIETLHHHFPTSCPLRVSSLPTRD